MAACCESFECEHSAIPRACKRNERHQRLLDKSCARLVPSRWLFDRKFNEGRIVADANQLKILREGIRAWNEWRSRQDITFRPDLAEANLQGIDLSGANLNQQSPPFGVNLGGADLSKADLSGANLREADLSGTIL